MSRHTYTAAPEDPELDRLLALPAGINPGSKLGSTMDRKPTPYRLDHGPGPLGDLDLAAEGTIRIERLDDDLVWIRVEHEDGAVVINLHVKGRKLWQTVELESTHNNPTTHKDNP